ncbi:MAG: DoxX family protein [Balneolaceae bacterium]
MIINLSPLLDIALLALRIIVAIIFFSSGKSHVMKPDERAESIGMSPGATRFLGIVEIAGAISVAAGFYIQVGAALLAGVMLGAIYKKTMVWGTGFYSEKGYGWHYDLLLLCANLVFLATGGSLVLAG